MFTFSTDLRLRLLLFGLLMPVYMPLWFATLPDILRNDICGDSTLGSGGEDRAPMESIRIESGQIRINGFDSNLV